MIKRVIFTPEAEDDITESYRWYESREPGLGEEFRRFPFEVFYEPHGTKRRGLFRLSLLTGSGSVALAA